MNRDNIANCIATCRSTRTSKAAQKELAAYEDCIAALRDSLAYIDSSAPITEGTTLEPHETVEIIVTVAGLAKLRAVLASLD